MKNHYQVLKAEKELQDSNEGRKSKRGTSTSSRQRPTLSIAVAGSVIDNAQTTELATLVAGQVARAAAIFLVDEIIVIDDSGSRKGEVGRGAAFLARVLQYLETPQYLRKLLIPMHEDLRFAGQLPPLDAPHHMRATEWCPYREGVVLSSAKGDGSLLDIGLGRDAHVVQALKPGVRATLSLGHQPTLANLTGSLVRSGIEVYKAHLAHPGDPEMHSGAYWGYQTRVAASFQDLMTGCPFKEGYDLKIGTSEHGTAASASKLQLPAFCHLLIAFGGPLGLEDCLVKDAGVEEKDPRKHFDMYINTCSNQGSRTIRTEEAILISLTYMQPAIDACKPNV